jgi:hypothetical protein
MSEGKWSIPAEYKGQRFRSTLEASWARFFDQHRMCWAYEPEAFQFDQHTKYIPDFWLPEINTVVEVKGMLDDDDKRKVFALAKRGAPLGMTVIIAGAPVGRHITLVEPTPLRMSCCHVAMDELTSDNNPPIEDVASFVFEMERRGVTFAHKRNQLNVYDTRDILTECECDAIEKHGDTISAIISGEYITGLAWVAANKSRRESHTRAMLQEDALYHESACTPGAISLVRCNDCNGWFFQDIFDHDSLCPYCKQTPEGWFTWHADEQKCADCSMPPRTYSGTIITSKPRCNANIDEILQYWNMANGCTMESQPSKAALKRWLKAVPVDGIKDAIDITMARRLGKDDRVKYLAGIMRRQVGDANCEQA